MDDHSGTIRTTTFTSLGRILGAHNMLTEQYEIRADFLVGG